MVANYKIKGEITKGKSKIALPSTCESSSSFPHVQTRPISIKHSLGTPCCRSQQHCPPQHDTFCWEKSSFDTWSLFSFILEICMMIKKIITIPIFFIEKSPGGSLPGLYFFSLLSQEKYEFCPKKRRRWPSGQEGGPDSEELLLAAPCRGLPAHRTLHSRARDSGLQLFHHGHRPHFTPPRAVAWRQCHGL